ncbi:hypothetical protein [Neobacillus sp. Marseille-QA0830]
MENYWLGFIFADWSFFLAAMILWGLIIVSGLLFIWGAWKKSWIAFLISGCALIFPAIVLATQGGWFYLFLLIPLVIFYLSFYRKKR